MNEEAIKYCINCEGTGQCPECDSGECSDCASDIELMEDCTTCYGDGYCSSCAGGAKCYECQGTGEEEADE